MGSSNSKDEGGSNAATTATYHDAASSVKDNNKIRSTNNQDSEGYGGQQSQYPIPTGKEYDKLDSLLQSLPKVMDAESQREVEEYIKSCDNGKGPAVACFSTAEYLSLMEQDYNDAVRLYETTCIRPITDNSPNLIEVKSDNTKCYPPSCFNLARFRMTGKGGTKFSHEEGYKYFKRACDAGHHGACHFQARMLASAPNSFEGVTHNPQEALRLFMYSCEDGKDSFSCFTAATMLLRGDKVSPEANNVSPGEARGVESIRQRHGEDDRRKRQSDQRQALKRNPVKAAQLLEQACNDGHPSSCYNLAVMYNIGDDGIPIDKEKSLEFQTKTEELVKTVGGLGMEQMGG